MRSSWWAIVFACAGVQACTASVPADRARRAERDQLLREVAGYRALEPLALTGLLSDHREIIVSLSDTLIRNLIGAAFPITLPVGLGVEVTLTSAAVQFRANVASVEVSGTARRRGFPPVSAAIHLRGALDAFELDSSRLMRARITIDDVDVGEPSGIVRFLAPTARAALQRVLERGLADLAGLLPAVAVPVRFDSEIRLPSLAGDGPLTARGATAPLIVVASRVLAFQDRLWIILRIERGDFVPIVVGP